MARGRDDVPQAVARCWERGALSYKLRPYQRAFYDAVWEAILDESVDIFAVLASRRIGKSYVLRLIASEVCRRVNGIAVNIFGPIGGEMRKINRRVMSQVLRDCPAELRPRYNQTEGWYSWPGTDSIMYTAGVNNGHEDDQRGNDAFLNIGDEAGFIDNLRYCMLDIYAPQTDTTGGTNVLTSTASKSPAHEFAGVYAKAELEGRAFKLTIDDTDYSEGEKRKIWSRYDGGIKSTSYRREYLCEFVVDDELHVIQEWSSKRYVKAADREDARYPLWHRYVAMDMGVSDLTAVIFGHYNFAEARFYIEREWCMNGPNMTTDLIAESVREVETELWGEGVEPYLRIADNNNPQLLNDLRAIHGMPFVPTSKEKLPEMVNEARLWVKEGRVHVDPECKRMVLCLESGIWRDGGEGAKKSRFIGREFAHLDGLGHLDHLAAFIYGIRNIDVSTNPIPETLGVPEGWVRTRPPEREEQGLEQLASKLRLRRVV